jgi:hypothetical protein
MLGQPCELRLESPRAAVRRWRPMILISGGDVNADVQRGVPFYLYGAQWQLCSPAQMPDQQPAILRTHVVHCPSRKPPLHFGPLSALRAHTTSPHKPDLPRGRLRAFHRPGRAPTVGENDEVVAGEAAVAAPLAACRGSRRRQVWGPGAAAGGALARGVPAGGPAVRDANAGALPRGPDPTAAGQGRQENLPGGQLDARLRAADRRARAGAVAGVVDHERAAVKELGPPARQLQHLRPATISINTRGLLDLPSSLLRDLI